uniref:Putative ovule protein n=1 Tax=Solanum chacoense TaxID=4108 RepID=A0A0V0GMP6_SOLCH
MNRTSKPKKRKGFHMETTSSRSNRIHTQNKSIQQTCHSQFPHCSTVNAFWLINVGVDFSTSNLQPHS